MNFDYTSCYDTHSYATHHEFKGFLKIKSEFSEIKSKFSKINKVLISIQ